MRSCDFFYNVSGEDAERLLREYGADGDFLARPSESEPSNYTLSIIRGSSITHVKIQSTGDGFDLFGGEQFGSLNDLVLYYMNNPGQLQEKNGSVILMRRAIPIPMDDPVNGDVRIPVTERWFHSDLTGSEAVSLLKKEKTWSYIVRESQREPGKYAITVKTVDETPVNILVQINPQTRRYHVGGGDEFDSILDMLNHYSTNPLVEEGSHRVVHLSHMIPSTSVPACLIEDRIVLLGEPHPISKKLGFTEEFERISERMDDQFQSKREGKREHNVDKNRYKNVVAYDHTRVLLRDYPQPREPMDTDYINANHIHAPSLTCRSPSTTTRKYISTQGCLPNTVVDFWRMVWQENTRVIVMTTREVERLKPKCCQYWPSYKEEQNLRGYYAKNVEETKLKDSRGVDIFIRRRFMISRLGAPQREIFHLQFIGWPDHGRPEHPESVVSFLEAVDADYKKAKMDQGPVVVHCSAGVGRTGTFIVIDIVLNQIRQLGIATVVDIPRTLMAIREQRSGMVQTEEQYEFMYRAISSYVKGMTNGKSTSQREKKFESIELPPPPVPRRHRAFVGQC